MKYIKLHYPDKEEVCINFDTVCAYTSSPRGGTYVYFAGSENECNFFEVYETPGTIDRLLEIKK